MQDHHKKMNLPSLQLGPEQHENWQSGEIPDALGAPHLYQGITLKRLFAYGVDLLILSVVILFIWLIIYAGSFITFGLIGMLLAPLMPLVPLAYHCFLIATPRGQTIGMRMMNIEVRTLRGDFLSLGQAFVMVALFYLTWMFPILFIAVFFDKRRRALHDILSGTVVINRQYD